MKENQSPTQSADNLEERISTLSDQLSKISGILGMVYSYKPAQKKGFHWNTTLFTDFCKLDPSGSYSELYKTFVEKVREEIDSILSRKKKFGKSTLKETIVQGKIDYAVDMLKIAELGAPFELQKAGIQHDLTQQQITKRIEQIRQIETPIFGGKVTDNRIEVEGSYRFLQKELEVNEELLTANERSSFEEYIAILQAHAKQLQTANKAEKTVKLGNMEPHKQITSQHQEKLNEQLDAGTVQKIYQLAFEIYEIDKPVTLSEDHNNMNNKPDAFYIPKNETYKISQILYLLQHELETHNIIEKSNKGSLGIKGAAYLTKEEGTAKAMEKMMKGEQLDSSTVTYALPQLAIGELVSGQKFLEFLRLHFKLKGKEHKYKSYFLRRKRNYPLDIPGVPQKDTSYSRGYKQVIEWTYQGKDPTEFFRNKVSFEDTKKIQELRSEDSQYIKPLLLGELLLFALTEHHVTEENFKGYIREKYNFLKKEHLSGKLSYLQKKKVVEIIKLFKQE